MRVCTVFDREEINEIVKKEGEYDSFIDYLNDGYTPFCNDVAVPWYIESPYEDDPDYEELNETAKAINQYMINRGCSLGELVYIDVTW